MNTALYSTCAIASLTALALRLPAAFRLREPSLIALCCYFAVSTLTFAISIPAVYATVLQLTGVPNLAGMLAQCGGVAIAVTQQAVVLAWEHPWRQAKRKIVLRLIMVGLAISCMVLLFVLSVPYMVESPYNFAADSAIIPTYSIYLIVFQASFLAGTIESVRLCWRYSQRIGPGWLRLGLRVASFGSGLGIPYSAVRITSILIAHTGGNTLRLEPIARLGAGGGTLLLLVGWTIPTWGPKLSAIWARLRRIKAYRSITPLWQALHTAVPEIVLTSAKRSQPISWPLPFDFRLYRRIVEIRDARMALLPFFDVRLSKTIEQLARDSGLINSQLDAVVEAANIAAAIEAKRLSTRDGTASPALVADYFDQPDDPGGSLHDELSWLAMVAIQFDSSPFVVTAISLVHTSNSSTTMD